MILSAETLAAVIHRIASTGADDPRVAADARVRGKNVDWSS